MDANLRPTEEKWMLRTSEILVGSSVYLLRVCLCVFHIFHFFVKMGIVIQSRGLLCRERVEIFFPKTLHKSVSPE